MYVCETVMWLLVAVLIVFIELHPEIFTRYRVLGYVCNDFRITRASLRHVCEFLSLKLNLRPPPSLMSSRLRPRIAAFSYLILFYNAAFSLPFVRAAASFSWSLSTPIQCANMTLSVSGGTVSRRLNHTNDQTTSN